MPVIHIEFDDAVVDQEWARQIAGAAQEIVSRVTQIEDVMVYANCAQIKVKVWPIEIFVRMSAHKISDADALIAKLKEEFSIWKKESGFQHPMNLSLIPMPWKIEIGI